MRGVLLAMAGCGRIAFDTLGDGELDQGTFHLAELGSTGTDEDPTLTSDMLQIYFASNRVGSQGLDIYRATRARTSDPWSAPENVLEVNTAGAEYGPALTSDGLTLYFVRGGNVYVSRRFAQIEPWSPPALISELSGGLAIDSPTVTDDQLWLGCANSVYAMYATTRASVASAWSPLTPIGELDSPQFDFGPHVNGDATRIVFTSERNGNRDLWGATRASRTDVFASPFSIDAVNTPAEESDPWLSADGRIIFFKSNTLAGDNELFMATVVVP